MAKIGLPKGSGKWLKVREKSGNFEMNIEWQPCNSMKNYPACKELKVHVHVCVLLQRADGTRQSRCHLRLTPNRQGHV